MKGRVIRAYGKKFIVISDKKEYPCEVLKKVKYKAKTTPVVVGDLVEFVYNDPGPGGIEKVEPRLTKFSRVKIGVEDQEQVIAANIDQMVIVVSVAHPRFKQHLIDRFSVAAEIGGLQTALVVNKIDLNHKVDLERVQEIYQTINIPTVLTSCTENKGIEQLQEVLKDHESILVGHSGVGKSSLLNLIQPGLKLKTGVVSKATDKGRHTTSIVELFPLEFGGYVVDTPGLKILGLWDLDKNDLDLYFPEFESLLGQCRFSRCTHLHEPQCAVIQAVNEGSIATERYESYQRIFNSF